ncbi:sensor histidine kinase [Acinetobacter sp. MD2(2019)]|uniref:sensor histidine kinase n=1 Tax=Acinetobacter sp. MD2(2019) TaxID=2605273 RepID=UPI002D1EED57|nr:ATP-binding protein [Acinetobacter sp. MD2(2019)]MEB3755135.1 histidine kinase [Acinetobacter sp. MD2(2019)]
MYKNKSFRGSQIAWDTPLKILIHTTILFICIAILCSTQSSYAENLHCNYNIRSIEKVRDPENLATPPKTGWIKTKLPDTWIKQKGWEKYTGAVWYRITWDQACPNQTLKSQPTFLSVSYMTLAGEVFNNSELIWQDASLVEPYSRSWNRPRYFSFPASTIKPHHNETLIKVFGIFTILPGLGEIQLGPQPSIIEHHLAAVWNNRTLIFINIVISLTLSALFFLVWVLNRKESAFGYFALASMIWVLFETTFLITTPFIFPKSDTLSRLGSIILLWHGYFFCLFTWRLIDQKKPRIEHVLLFTCFVLSISMLMTTQNYFLLIQLIAFLFYSILFISNCLFIQWTAISDTRIETRILAGLLFLFMLILIHDIAMVANEKREQIFASYSSIAMTIALSLILSRRIFRSFKKIMQFNQTLQMTVEQANADLTTALEKEYLLEFENIRLQERLKLSHELHDSLGGSLVRSMIIVDKNENLERNHFISILKLLRSDLRQIIDTGSNANLAVPLSPMLWCAPLRHRFVQVFEEMDIESEWVFTEQWKHKPKAQHCLTLSRVVEEALTNVIKHSRATHVVISLQETKHRKLHLKIQDNGIGFDPSTVQEGLHVGLQSMQARVHRIGGEFMIFSELGSTILEIIV